MFRQSTQGIDYSSKDYEAFRSMMIEALTEKMPEYTDHRQTDAGIVLIELLAKGLDILSFYQDIIANEVFLPTEEQRDNVLKWCNLLGYTPQVATPAHFKQVFRLKKNNLETLIPKGTRVKTNNSSSEEAVYFETEEDLIIPTGSYGDEKDENNQYKFAVSVVEGRKIGSVTRNALGEVVSLNGESIGISTGVASQEFNLSYTPVIIDSIEIYSQKGNEKIVWTRVDSFVESSANSNHFVVSEDEDYNITVHFGDGIFGRIPATGADIQCVYRIGGGEQGNVGANKIVMLDTNADLGIEETFNPDLAYDYGRDRESLEDIKLHAPVMSRTRWGALTLSDFEEVLKSNFPEILHTHAERDTFSTQDLVTVISAMTDPQEIIETVAEGTETVGGLQEIDDIKIWIYLKNGESLTEDYKQTIIDFFDENKGGRKIIGTRNIELYDAPVESIDVSLILYVARGYNLSVVEAQVRNTISNFINPNNLNIGEPLMLSELLAQIHLIDGVRGVQFRNPADEITYFSNKTVITLNSITCEVAEV